MAARDRGHSVADWGATGTVYMVAITYLVKGGPRLDASAISAHASRDSLNTPPAAASSKVSFPRASTEAMSTNRSCSLKEYRQMVHLSRPFHHQLGLRLHVAASPAADSAIVTGSLLAKVKILPRRRLN